jgi:hypothetical protein
LELLRQALAEAALEKPRHGEWPETEGVPAIPDLKGAVSPL